jgi:hypothetical protein
MYVSMFLCLSMRIHHSLTHSLAHSLCLSLSLSLSLSGDSLTGASPDLTLRPMRLTRREARPRSIFLNGEGGAGGSLYVTPPRFQRSIHMLYKCATSLGRRVARKTHVLL